MHLAPRPFINRRAHGIGAARDLRIRFITVPARSFFFTSTHVFSLLNEMCQRYKEATWPDGASD